MTMKLKEVQINLNDRVQVNLTEYGKEIYCEYYNKLHLGSLKLLQSELITSQTMQLWELMNIFGSKMSIGMGNVMFENNDIHIYG